MAAVITLATTLGLGGCSESENTPAATPSTTTSVSPAADPIPGPSATTAAEPAAPQPPRARRGPAGQEAFARFVMDAWSWSLRTNDASPLLDAGVSRKQPCDGCTTLARELDGRVEAGWYVDFPGLTVERTRLRPDAGAVVAVSKVAVPESDSYLDDGSYRSTSPAHDDATFTVTMRWVKGAYRLVSFTVT